MGDKRKRGNGMKLFRYELHFFGEAQGIGFIQGLEDIGIPENLINLLIARFDEELPIPDFSSFDYEKGKEYPASYFSEQGFAAFRETIQTIISSIEELDNGWEVVLLERESPNTGIVYQDAFQMMIKQPYLW